MHVSERNRGYFQALYGMLLTQKNNDDRYAFLSGVDLTNRKQLKHYRQEFLSHAESRLHAEYDRGFFEAWADYMRILPKLEASVSPAIDKGVAETEKEESEAGIEAKAEAETTNQIGSEEPAKEKTELEPIEPRQRTLVDFAK